LAIYYDLLIDVLQSVGIPCAVNDINEGWERRSRSSGGFSAPPLGVCWHHTASSASVNSDLSYMINGSPDRPIGNMLLDRDGVVWPIAAGGANTQGKGGPTTFTRGTVPLDQGNTTMWGVEAQNNGVGQPWPQVQIDSYFACNEALAEMFGNSVTDCISHHGYAPSRKIDPATSAAVQGPWRPHGINSSGTWDYRDIRDEAARRGTYIPEPTPQEDEMATVILAVQGRNAQFIGQGPLLADGTVHNLFVTWYGPGPEGNPFLSDHAGAPDTKVQPVNMETLKRDIVLLGDPEAIEDSTGRWSANDFYRVVR
jgi:N-acetylmuramoyl-L-alanine amidase